ncbi:hypothetical protein [uncultured Sunxiuqinia sp.]|uniref:HYC_CC_PP family protein n=1 Tax=uncultured Sunxiuqinia sp. TaxID=1573825 RepID=UPI0037489865
MILFIVVPTIGFTITKHYCGEVLVDLSLTGDVKSCCDMQGDCCHNEAETFQMDQDYTCPFVLNHIDYFSSDTFEIPTLLIGLQEETNTSLIILNYWESPPPKDVLRFLSDVQVFRL